jgi:DNA-directed RNA polymerase specialized sigma24 family protein
MSNKKPSINQIIEQAVQTAMVSAIAANERRPKDAFKATERRLFAYPAIKLHIADTKEKMEEIRAYGTPTTSKSITKYNKSGMRLTPEEIQEALLQDLTAVIARNEEEIETIDRAMAAIAKDPDAELIKYRYFEGMPDKEIAEIMFCDATTIWRKKNRLIANLSVFLYGVEAVM